MDVRKELFDIIQDYVEVDVKELSTSENFKFAAGLDSFSLMALIAAIEEHFGIHIPNPELKAFRTLDDIIAYVERATQH